MHWNENFSYTSLNIRAIEIIILWIVVGGGVRDETSYSRTIDNLSDNYDDDMEDRFAQVKFHCIITTRSWDAQVTTTSIVSVPGFRVL